MKSIFVILMLICSNLAHAQIFTFKVPMTCEKCSNAISKALSEKFGEKIATNIDVEKNRVVVDTKANVIEANDVKETISTIGFTVKLISTIPSK